MSSQEESSSEKEKPTRTLNVFLSIRSRVPSSTSYDAILRENTKTNGVQKMAANLSVFKKL